MKNITNFIGWLLLAAVLIVPAFLFYNWWTNKKTIQLADNTPAEGGAMIGDVFKKDNQNLSVDMNTSSFVAGGARKSGIVNDSSDEISQNEGGDQNNQTYQKQTGGADVSPDFSTNKSAVQDQAESIVSVESVSPESDMADKPAKYAQSKSTQPPKASYFDPKSDKDPTISPSEYAKIKEDRANILERERLRRLEELRRSSRNSVKYKLKFQGVIGNNVIINGEMYSVGDRVMGAKIIKIGSNYFIAVHKGKRFRKTIK